MPDRPWTISHVSEITNWSEWLDLHTFGAFVLPLTYCLTETIVRRQYILFNMNSKTKMGRPPLPKGAAKGVLIGARFSPEEASQVEKAVKRAKAVKSDWIRTILLGAAT